jgi:archaeal flagellar protein FlaI
MVNYEVIREAADVILRFNFEDYNLTPSIEDDSKTMFQAIKALSEVKNASKIVFFQKRDYEYDNSQTALLREIAQIFDKMFAEKDSWQITSMLTGNPIFDRSLSQRYTELQNILLNSLRADPFGSYTTLKRMLRHSHINIQKIYNQNQIKSEQKLSELLEYVVNTLENTTLIKLLLKNSEGYSLGNRDIYSNIFSPIIKPDFMFTKLMANFPKDGEIIDSFKVGSTEVTIFKMPFTSYYLYHIMPLEFQLNEDQYELLDTARNILAEHKPERSEFIDPLRMREVFYNIGYDLITEIAQQKNLYLEKEEKENLTKILLRYTVGFGLVEALLEDEDMQDVSVNSPQGSTSIFIVHGKYNECITNILPTPNEAESWATKLRLISGRSLDEADPILDTELELPHASVRVSAITSPLDPSGLAFSFRRHRDRPWTLPLFIKNKMINPLGAGLLSFLIDGNRSFLICGTRSSGKSSFLSAVMVEIMRRYRIITVEDTLELPTNKLRDIGFNIQSLKVASALGAKTSEVEAQEGIRATLRLGDSALIIGEVRSDEAKALYEAMRVGAAANVVAGTIHGDSPYGIYDRVVNDIGVPKTSFKATDIIVIANPVKSADGMHKSRRITQITEVRKDWTEDPLKEHGFVDLMRYNAITDELEATDALKGGDSEVLKTIAGNIKEFSGSWEAIWDNIVLRSQVKEFIVKTSIEEKEPELLEAEFTAKCNDALHTLSEKFKVDGRLKSNEILESWKDWLKREVRKIKHG